MWEFKNNHSHNQRAAGLGGEWKSIHVSHYLWAVWPLCLRIRVSRAKERPCCYANDTTLMAENGKELKAWDWGTQAEKKACFKNDMILRYDMRAHVIKGKMDNLDLVKVKNFYVSEDTIKKVRRQPTWRGKIFANHISDKRVISWIYR